MGFESKKLQHTSGRKERALGSFFIQVGVLTGNNIKTTSEWAHAMRVTFRRR